MVRHLGTWILQSHQHWHHWVNLHTQMILVSTGDKLAGYHPIIIMTSGTRTGQHPCYDFEQGIQSPVMALCVIALASIHWPSGLGPRLWVLGHGFDSPSGPICCTGYVVSWLLNCFLSTRFGGYHWQMEKMVLRIDISRVLIALASMVHNYERSWFLFQAIWHSTQILSEHETQ